MRLDSRDQSKPAGVLVDTGTGKRIPFAIWADFDTGEYEAWRATSDGRDFLTAEDCVTPITYRGRAKGQLKLESWGRAKDLLPKAEEQKVVKIDVVAGFEMYKDVYFRVWGIRGDSVRTTSKRMEKFLENSPFLDALILKRRR